MPTTTDQQRIAARHKANAAVATAQQQLTTARASGDDAQLRAAAKALATAQAARRAIG